MTYKWVGQTWRRRESGRGSEARRSHDTNDGSPLRVDSSSAGVVLKESLAKVLVHYYPLAGRLTISGEGKLAVDCTGEGAVFVEAEADCAMADIGDVTEPDPSVLGKLVYSVPGAKNILEMPLLVAQV